MTLLQIADIFVAGKPLVQQPFIGQLINHPGVSHEVLHGPAGQAQQAKQALLYLRALYQQGEVAFAPQQRLEPIDEAQHCRLAALAAFERQHRPLHQAGQAQLAHTTPVYVTVDRGGFRNADTLPARLSTAEGYLKELEAENAKLKRMYADQALELTAIKDVLTRKL